MAGETVKSLGRWWRFENAPGINSNLVYEEVGDGLKPRYLIRRGDGCTPALYPEWVIGCEAPHWDGSAATQCTEDGNILMFQRKVAKGIQTPNVWNTQVGGDHYTQMKIQPLEYSMANGLDAMQHTIIKYISRFRNKNGIQDLEKARQAIDLLIQWEKDHATAK